MSGRRLGSASSRPAVFRAATNLVRVDVVVRDRNGNIVRGLKAEDFVVTEDGKAQQVTSFDFEEIATDALPPHVDAVPGVLGLEQLQSAAQRSAIVGRGRQTRRRAGPSTRRRRICRAGG